MKHLRRLVLLLAVSLFTASADAQVSNIDTMIHKLFTTLKQKDEASFVALYPNGTQMANLVKGMLETVFKSEEMQKMLAMDEKSKNMNIDSLVNAQVSQMNKPETQAEMKKAFAKNFQDIIEKGEKKGVNWSQAQLVSYTLDSTSDASDEEMKMFAGAGVKNLRGVISFNSGGTDYEMNFDKILRIPTEGGWFGGELKQVIKKGESFTVIEGVNNEFTAADTTVATVSTPETATKTKTKTDGNKTKTKTKTPANKTKTKTKAKA
jgi:hypothetical protein